MERRILPGVTKAENEAADSKTLSMRSEQRAKRFDVPNTSPDCSRHARARLVGLMGTCQLQPMTALCHCSPQRAPWRRPLYSH